MAIPWFARYSQASPESARPTVERVVVEGMTCPQCGGSDVRRYPVSNQYGPRMATKCQDCLCTLAIERPGPDDLWPSYRSVTTDWTPSPIESSNSGRGKKAAA
jgi:hypothetical protein